MFTFFIASVMESTPATISTMVRRPIKTPKMPAASLPRVQGPADIVLADELAEVAEGGAELLPGEEAVDQEQDAASREDLLGGRHLRHVEAGRARTFHAPLLSTAARSRGRALLRRYPRAARRRSQTPCGGRRSRRRFVIAPTRAITPPVAPTHGPQDAAWNVGGKAIARADPAARRRCSRAAPASRLPWSHGCGTTRPPRPDRPRRPLPPSTIGGSVPTPRTSGRRRPSSSTGRPSRRGRGRRRRRDRRPGRRAWAPGEP